MYLEMKKTLWFLWPFVVVWNLLAAILKMTGRLVAAILGLVFIIVGFILTVTVVGAIVGIPLAAFGFLLMLRSIF
ncbi:MAG: hypothetical protein DWQ07_24235 [Chloroflexi bacterium]|nr:MAG: hypothetical protein DWQ07_24235 [Chloroflexota bacterium]MBL1196243.1 hypothetical protein [Chloroflexota bacterium]